MPRSVVNARDIAKNKRDPQKSLLSWSNCVMGYHPCGRLCGAGPPPVRHMAVEFERLMFSLKDVTCMQSYNCGRRALIR